MKVNKLLAAMLVAGLAAPTLAATQLVTSFESGETHGFVIGSYGDVTASVVTEHPTDGSDALKAELGAKYAGGAKIYAASGFGWGSQKHVIFDIVNTTGADINYGVKVLSENVWDDAHSLSEYFNVTANSTAKDVKFSLDSTEWGDKGSSYNQATIMELQFFTTESPNQVIYIDNIRVSDGNDSLPVTPTAAAKVPTAPVKTLLQLATFDEMPPSSDTEGTTASLELTEEGVSIGQKALQATYTSSWSLVKFNGNWDFSGLGEEMAVAVDVTNPTGNSLYLYSRMEDDSGADASGIARGTLIPAGATKTVFLSVKDNAALNVVDQVGMRQIPADPMDEGWGTWPANINLAAIQSIQFFIPDLPAGATEHQFIFDNLRVIPDLNHASGYEAMVDALGQNNHYDFANKLESKEQLAGLGEKEAQRLGQLLNRSKYGGAPSDAGITADQNCVLNSATAASFNACQTSDGKWYLVDSDGNAFFSVGLANVRLADTYTMTGASNDTPSTLRQGMFVEVPADYVNEYYGPTFSGPVTKGQAVSFYGNNRDARHGDEATWRANTVKRFKDWGFNTLGNWTDPAFYAESDIPFVMNGWVNSGVAREVPAEIGPSGYWGRLPDPWDPKFASNAVLMAKEVAEQISAISDEQKKRIIGIFVDNEMSWDDEGDSTKTYTNVNSEAKTMQEIAEQYYSVVKSALAAEGLDNYLYLGNRFADWGRTPEVVEVASRYADVLSFNIYKADITDQGWDATQLAQLATLDKPVIIGEYHFGALDSGNFGEGIQKADSQADRADKYAAYMESVLANKNFVGAHWFQYIDSPVSGRAWDGENYNVGFVNVTDAPYTEMTDKARTVNCGIYGDDCSTLDAALYDGSNIGVTQADLLDDDSSTTDPETGTGTDPEPDSNVIGKAGSFSWLGLLSLILMGLLRRRTKH